MNQSRTGNAYPKQFKQTADRPNPFFIPKRGWRLKRALIAILTVLALAFAYVFLLLGEPDEDAKTTVDPAEERILMPMNAMESLGDSNAQTLADQFGAPVLVLYGGSLKQQRSRVSDAAFQGAYARRATLTYEFSDGEVLTVESIRPTAAVTLLGGSGYSLNTSALYALGGLDAARMDSADSICVFGQSDRAAYAVICPQSRIDDLSAILGQTTLIAPNTTD